MRHLIRLPRILSPPAVLPIPAPGTSAVLRFDAARERAAQARSLLAGDDMMPSRLRGTLQAGESASLAYAESRLSAKIARGAGTR